MRSELTSAGLPVEGFDVAMAAFEALPHDAAGDFDGPPCTVTQGRQARPEPRTMGPPGAEELGIQEFDSAVASGTLVRIEPSHHEKGICALPEDQLDVQSDVSWETGLAGSWKNMDGFWHPVFAVFRSSTNRERARLIADMREINSLFPTPPSFVLPSFISALPWASIKFAMKLDLVSAFWTLRTSKRLQRMFKCAGPIGREGDYTWRGLPMGWSHSPFIFHTALGPILEFVRAQGFLCGKYLDDFIIGAACEVDCRRAFDCLQHTVLRCGFDVCAKKTSHAPSRDLTFLGMGIDLSAQNFYWPAEKACSVVAWATEAVRASRLSRTALMSWIGRTAFLAQCCPLVAAWRRCLERSTAGGERWIVVSDAMREELRFWSRVESLIGTSFPFATGERLIVRTDASDVAGGIRIAYTDGQWREYSIPLPLWLRPRSSAARELYVSLAGLQVLEHTVTRPLWRVAIDLYSDSTASVGAMSRGGRADDMVELTRLLLDFQTRTSSVIRPHWIPREELEREDTLSRVVRGDAAMFVPGAREGCVAVAFGGRQIAFDMFADAANAVCERFAAIVPGQGTAFDGLGIEVEPFSWAFPPFALARAAARRLEAARVPAILVAPVGRIPGGWAWKIKIPAETPILLQPPSYESPACASPLELEALVYGVPPPNVGDAILSRSYRVEWA